MNQTSLDLQDDFSKLLFLAQSAYERVLAHHLYLSHSAGHYLHLTHAHLLKITERLESSYKTAIEMIMNCQVALEDHASLDIKKCISQKSEISHLLRILQSELGSLLSAGDWQSPTYEHAVLPLAGKQTGLISGGMNDYKRDVHLDARTYEKLFRKEYIDAGRQLFPAVALTSSGMSAFATVINFLKSQLKNDDVILVGRNSYFQNQWLLNQSFEGRIIFFDELDSAGILETARKLKPAAIIFDTLCNSESIQVLDLKIILPKLSKCLPRNSYLVIDNTTMSVSCQPLKYLPAFSFPQYFIIESLAKYHQFGMDRVTGGVICSSLSNILEIQKNRMHMGTIMTDTSALSLPVPNRRLLDIQLRRFDRNATMLAKALEEKLKSNPHRMISNIAYPGLESYQGYSWTKDDAFHGSFFTINFKPGFRKINIYEGVINEILSLAKKTGLNIVAGTSFGMDATRLYLVAKYAEKPMQPFIRVSVGTETHQEMSELINIFINALWP